jgi:hypothetical protein
MIGVMEWWLVEREGLEPFNAEPFVFGDERSPVREEMYESVIWKDGEEIRRKGRRGREGKNTFEWSRTTGGRKEGAEEGRWLCLALAVAVNRGFGNN